MSVERKDREEPAGLRELWEITKPDDPRYAEKYFELLQETLKIPKLQRFESPFQRPKKSGGSRTIVSAAEPLRSTQYFLANWIRDNLPQGQDYCYTGRKVNAALEVHRESKYALVCDLKDAFDQVSEQKIKNWFSLYDHRLRGEPLNVMADLLTYRGRAPQGCRSTAFTYNVVVVAEMDRHLDRIAPTLGVEKWTRYSDNICMSAKNEINFAQIHDQVKSVAKGFGFELSWDRPFVGNIEYLGARITGGNIFIPDEKVGELADRIFDWLESDNPQEHYHQALGILTWARGLSGPNVSSYLLDMLNIYFKEVEKPSEVERIMGKAHGRLLKDE